MSGMMGAVPQGSLLQITPFGAVPKPNGDVRIIVDGTATGVNICMSKLELKLPRVEEALLATTSTSVLGKRDLKRGFYHILLQEEERKYLLSEIPSPINWEGGLLCPLVLHRAQQYFVK